MASKILLSPSETALKKALGDDSMISTLCEEKGADILIYSERGLVGLQRKSVPNDFITSFTDGRFARLLPLLTTNCAYYRVICEGRLKFWPDGTVHMGVTKRRERIKSRFNRSHIHGMLNDLEFMYGIQVHWTEDIDDTVRYIQSIQRFMASDKHVGLFTRPKAQKSWTVRSTEDIHLWILQSFDGIGVNTASKIIDHFGKAPLRWTCSVDELSKIPGVTTKAAKNWVSCLNTTELDKKRLANIADDDNPKFAEFTKKSSAKKGSYQGSKSANSGIVSKEPAQKSVNLDHLRKRLRGC